MEERCSTTNEEAEEVFHDERVCVWELKRIGLALFESAAQSLFEVRRGVCEQSTLYLVRFLGIFALVENDADDLIGFESPVYNIRDGQQQETSQIYFISSCTVKGDISLAECGRSNTCKLSLSDIARW